VELDVTVVYHDYDDWRLLGVIDEASTAFWRAMAVRLRNGPIHRTNRITHDG
jgi:hypothetical protein